MYFIRKGKKVVPTTDAGEVTKENFVCEPGTEEKVWCKLEQYEFDRVTGEKKTLVNQVMGENPRDFEMFAPVWKRQGMTITMLHDPRGEVQEDDVARKLALLNGEGHTETTETTEKDGPTKEELEEGLKKTIEAKEQAERKAAEMEAELAALKANIEAEAKAKADAEAEAKAEAESKANAQPESKETPKGKTK